jgi:hypothetical protein
VTIERSGWVTLLAVARGAFEGRGSLRLSSRGEVAVLRCGGGGRPVVVGGRDRIVVPCWLRDASGPEGSLLVGTATEHVLLRGDVADEAALASTVRKPVQVPLRHAEGAGHRLAASSPRRRHVDRTTSVRVS